MFENRDSYKHKFISDDMLYTSVSYDNISIDNRKVEDLYRIYDKMHQSYPLLLNEEDNILGNSDIKLYSINDNEIKPIILIVGGVHGNEKSSVYGVLYSVNAILRNSNGWAKSIIDNFSVYVIPCLNTYGFNHVTRENENKVDINRDFGKDGFNEVGSKAILNFFKLYGDRIKIVIDSHNCGRVDDFYPFSVVAPENCKYFKLYDEVVTKISYFLAEKKPKYNQLTLIPSPNEGTFSSYINDGGYIGHTLETPKSIINNGDDRNYKSGVEITKDLLINLLLIYSELLIK